VWDQFLIAKIAADCSEQVQRAVLRDQIEMAGGSEMTRVRSKPPLGLHAEDGIEGFEDWQEATDIGWVAGVDHIDIVGIHRSAVHGSG
jgi:hypothetical protein